MTLLTLALLAAPAQEPAAMHPADAAILVQVPDFQAVVAAYAETAYAQLLADPDLHAAIGNLQGTGEPVDPREMLLGLWAMQAQQQPDAPGPEEMGALARSIASVSFSLSVPDGDIVAFIAGGEAAEDDAAYVAENLTVRSVVEFNDAETAAGVLEFLRSSMENEGQGYLAEDGPVLGGAFGDGPVTRLSILQPSGPNGELEAPHDQVERSVRLIHGGRRIALLMGAEDDATALGRMVDDAPDAATRFAAAREGFSKGAGTVVFEAIVQPFVERLVAEQQPQALPVLDIVEGLVGPLGTMLIRGGEWRMSIVDGQFVTDGSYPRSASNPMAGLLGAKPLDAADLGLIRPDAVLAWAVSLDKDVLMRMFEGAMAQGGERAQQEIEQLELAFGFRPDRDLIAPLGDAVSYSMPPLGALLSAPPFMVSVDVADIDAFTRGIEGLFNLIETQAGDEIQLAREEYKDVRTFTITLPDMGEGIPGLPISPSSYFKPTIAVGQGRAFVTTLRSHARKEIRRVDKLKGEIELHPTLTADVLPEGATEVGYADWGELVGKVYAGLKGFAPMLAGMGGEIPFDLNALPEADVLTRHFKPSLRWKRIDGAKARAWARSSFGPETAAVILGGAGAAVVGMTTVSRIEGPIEEPMPAEFVEIQSVEAEMAQITADRLRGARLDIEVHRTETGSLPGTLEALGAPVPNDAWGHPILYQVTGDTYRIWSAGPDGTDNGGAGDDILLGQ